MGPTLTSQVFLIPGPCTTSRASLAVEKATSFSLPPIPAINVFPNAQPVVMRRHVSSVKKDGLQHLMANALHVRLSVQHAKVTQVAANVLLTTP